LYTRPTYHSATLFLPFVIQLEAGIDAQMHVTQLAHNLTPPSSRPTLGTHNTLASFVSMLRPVTMQRPAATTWDCCLYVSARGGEESCYLLQQLLAKVKLTCVCVLVSRDQSV
jgi:hypothetical protein